MEFVIKCQPSACTASMSAIVLSLSGGSSSTSIDGKRLVTAIAVGRYLAAKNGLYSHTESLIDFLEISSKSSTSSLSNRKTGLAGMLTSVETESRDSRSQRRD
jgi:hypothetical protein